MVGFILSKSLATGPDLTQGINCSILYVAQRVVESDWIIHTCTHTLTPKQLQVKTTFLSFLGRKRGARIKGSPDLQHTKKEIKSMRFRIMWLMSCSSFPFHSHVSGTEFYHFDSQPYFKYMHWGKKWNSMGDFLCLGLREEQKPLVSPLNIQAARTLVSIFFFYLTCIAKTLQSEPLWQIRNSLLIKWETVYKAILPISVGFHTTEAGIVSWNSFSLS